MTTIRRGGYDALYDNDWTNRPYVELYGDGTVSFETIMRFAQFMSKSLGFRLKVTFRHKLYTVRFTKVS